MTLVSTAECCASVEYHTCPDEALTQKAPGVGRVNSMARRVNNDATAVRSTGPAALWDPVPVIITTQRDDDGDDDVAL